MHQHPDYAYLDTLRTPLHKGYFKGDRTGTGCLSTFGQLKRYDLSEGKLPVITTKKIFLRSFIHETLWFISGSTDVAYLKKNGISIWDSWVDPSTALYRDLTHDERYELYVKRCNEHLDAYWKAVENNPDEPLIQMYPPSGPARKEMTSHEFMDAYEIPRKVLVGGSIGKGAYGAMWRNWEDERVITIPDPTPHTWVYLDEEVNKVVREQNKPELTTYWRKLTAPLRKLDVYRYPVDLGDPAENLEAWTNAGEIAVFLDRYKLRPIPKRELPEQYVKRGYTAVGRVEPIEPPALGYCHAGAVKWVIQRRIDQLANAIELLRTNPDSRRIIVTAWNPGRLEEAQLPPCHSLYQFWTRPLGIHELEREIRKRDLSGEYLRNAPELSADSDELAYAVQYAEEHGVPTRALSCLLFQRSADVPVGVPFNIAQYGLLTHMVAQCANMVAEELIWVGGDTHVYQDQVDLAKEQLNREVYTDVVARVELDPTIREIDDFTFDHIAITGYDRHHPAIKYPVAV